jgi:protein-S-isoprenylcysteine O-methyltransferase Ste14
MFSELAIMMIMMWPAIPMFLIELQLAISFWRRIGLWTYLVIVAEWSPIGIALYLLQNQLLSFEVTLGTPFLTLGIILIAAALGLHTWTAKLIGLKATVGYAELKPDEQLKNQNLVVSGPFSVVRHPSYWAHTAIMTGILFVTGVVATGIIALIDLTITYFITTTLEDRELVDRFGSQYKEYQKRIPKFFPRITKR